MVNLIAKSEVRPDIDADALGRVMASLVDGMVSHRALFSLPDARYQQMQNAAMRMLDRNLRR